MFRFYEIDAAMRDQASVQPLALSDHKDDDNSKEDTDPEKSNDGKEDEDDGSWHDSNFDFGAVDCSGSNANAGPDSVDDFADEDVILEKQIKTPRGKNARSRRATPLSLSATAKRRKGNVDLLSSLDEKLESLHAAKSLQIAVKQREVAVLEKRWEAEEKTIDSVARRNVANARRSDAESEKCLAETKKLVAEATSLEISNKEKLLLMRHNLRMKGIPEEKIDALFPISVDCN